MRYRCPLCLKPLERDDQLWKFCPLHREANPDPLNPYDPREDSGGFFCAERGCESHGRFHPDGLLYRHENCRLEITPGVFQPLWNPFWSPGATQVNNWVTVRRDGQEVRQQVHHWELDALQQAQAVGSQEMWFPAGLLVREGGNPHVLVSFSGAKGEGKTYLAMRLLDAHAYSGALRPLEEFLYLYSYSAQTAPAAPEAAQGSASVAITMPTSAEFLETLYLREMLRNADPGHFREALNATVGRPRNLKAAMFPHRVEEEPEAESTAGARGGLLRRLLSPRHARQYVEAIGATLSVRGLAPHWPYRGLLVYDLAGEAVEVGHIDVRRHDEEMDVLAVLLSAEHLSSRVSSTQAIAVASDRLNHAHDVKNRRRKLRCCLIVTKCDVWPGRPAPDRRQLLESLRTMASCRPAAALEREVAAAGRSRATIDEIFFTWRESRTKSLEVVHGLDEFVTWCMQ